MNNSANNVVVITGASAGIGQAIALYLANKAFSLVLVARRLDRINALVDQIIQQGGKAIAVKADVTRQEEVQAAIDAAVTAYQRVDVLINNAGYMAIAPISERKTDEWDKMIDTNLKGVLYGIAAALPVFQRQGSGHFINVASVAGIKVLAPGGVVYSATKFAVRALSEGLRQEAGKTIRTTLISPAPSKANCSSAVLIKTAWRFCTNSISRLFRLTPLPEPFYLPLNSLATLILMKLWFVRRRKNFSMP